MDHHTAKKYVEMLTEQVRVYEREFSGIESSVETLNKVSRVLFFIGMLWSSIIVVCAAIYSKLLLLALIPLEISTLYAAVLVGEEAGKYEAQAFSLGKTLDGFKRELCRVKSGLDNSKQLDRKGLDLWEAAY